MQTYKNKINGESLIKFFLICDGGQNLNLCQKFYLICNSEIFIFKNINVFNTF